MALNLSCGKSVYSEALEMALFQAELFPSSFSAELIDELSKYTEAH